jgi:hypothetical protein
MKLDRNNIHIWWNETSQKKSDPVEQTLPIFLAFWPFPWQQQPFWKNQPLKAQLHMAYDIPTRFHKV